MKQIIYRGPRIFRWGIIGESREGLFKPELLVKEGYLPMGDVIRGLEEIIGTFDQFNFLGTEKYSVAFIDGNPMFYLPDIAKEIYQGKALEYKEYADGIIAVGGEDASASLIARVQKSPPERWPSFTLKEKDNFYTNLIVAIVANSSIERELTQYFLDKGWEWR